MDKNNKDSPAGKTAGDYKENKLSHDIHEQNSDKDSSFELQKG